MDNYCTLQSDLTSDVRHIRIMDFPVNIYGALVFLQGKSFFVSPEKNFAIVTGGGGGVEIQGSCSRYMILYG